jgi:hypothetical protein
VPRPATSPPPPRPAQQAAQQPAPLHIPRSLAEVDNGKVLGFGADLAEDHPGYADAAYKQVRPAVGAACAARVCGGLWACTACVSTALIGSGSLL